MGFLICVQAISTVLGLKMALTWLGHKKDLHLYRSASKQEEGRQGTWQTCSRRACVLQLVAENKKNKCQEQDFEIQSGKVATEVHQKPSRDLEGTNSIAEIYADTCSFLMNYLGISQPSPSASALSKGVCLLVLVCEGGLSDNTKMSASPKQQTAEHTLCLPKRVWLKC